MDFSIVEKHLQQEEQAGPAMTRAELVHRHAARTTLGEELNALHAAVNALYSRYHRLAKLPNLLHVEWANALLHFPNLVFFVIDSTGVRAESDIIRVHLSDMAGNPVFDHIIRPQRQPGQANTQYTGIAHAHISTAPVLADIWDDLQAALMGRYILAYNWEFLMERLRENAGYYQLAPLYPVGECLMNRASNYYGTAMALKLADVCSRIGHILPHPATALDRAAGQLAFLQAMAEGITTVHVTQSLSDATEDDGLDDLDAHPF
jgi:DNA polymerase III alpha subunit (gram-positive type)